MGVSIRKGTNLWKILVIFFVKADVFFKQSTDGSLCGNLCYGKDSGDLFTKTARACIPHIDSEIRVCLFIGFSSMVFTSFFLQVPVLSIPRSTKNAGTCK